MKNKMKLLTTALILVLFTLSPLAKASSSTTARNDAKAPTSRAPTSSQLAKMSLEQRVKALEPWLQPSGAPVLSNLGKYTAAQIYQALGVSPLTANKACATGCSYIADEIGAIQAINSKKLMASILTGASGDLTTCPTSAYFAAGIVWVSDPCGNGYAGEIRTFNPTTWAQGTPITANNQLPEPAFMVLGPDGNLYVTNFGYGLTSYIDPSNGAYLGVFGTCFNYPEFLDSDPANGNIYIGDTYAGLYYDYGYSSIPGCMTAYNTATQGIYTVVLSNDVCTGCGSAAGVSVNQKSGTIYGVDPWSAIEGSTNDVYEVAGLSQTGFIEISPYAYEPWGSTYDPANHDVLVVVPVDTSCSTSCGGFESISAGNGLGALIDTGFGPNDACYNTGKVATVPESESVLPVLATNVKSDLALKQITLSTFGPNIDPFGCGGS